MKKYILGSALGLSVILAAPGVIRANEGLVDLRGAGSSGACFASSIFIDGAYKILATCRDLKIALTPERNKYVLWMEDDQLKQRRLGEIVSGKFFGQVDQKFPRLFVTAERDPYTNKASEEVLLTGNVREIDFGAGVAPVKAIITPTPTPQKEVVATKVAENQDIVVKEGGLGGTVSTVFKIVLLGFGALLLIVGITSFMSRRRSL